MQSWHVLIQLVLLVSMATCMTKTQQELGNDCPESRPWPCRTPSVCLSFDFICDGEPDCPDEYDEDPAMCIAKHRPAPEHLAGFIHKYQDWLIPRFLGRGTPEELAAKLIRSQTIADYAKNANLEASQVRNLEKMMEGVRDGRQIDLLALGMPLGAWPDFYSLFHRIYLSGFLGNTDRFDEEELQPLNNARKRFLWGRRLRYRNLK